MIWDHSEGALAARFSRGKIIQDASETAKESTIPCS
jgi:hypothetical protein